MTIAQLLSLGTARLTTRSPSPALDAEVLLAFALDQKRITLLQHSTGLVETAAADFFLRLVNTRRRNIPVAYITGRQAFMDFEVEVTPHTLVPRPFTESLVDAVLKELGTSPHVISDIGTGSGAIAIALAKHATTSRVIATDISIPALRVAAANARQHHLLRQIDLRAGSLLHPLRPDDGVTAIVANLPYLPASDVNEPTIQHEPRFALYGGRDGLTLISELLTQTSFFPTIRLVALELLPRQVDIVAYLLRCKEFDVFPISDGQFIRGLIGRK